MSKTNAKELTEYVRAVMGGIEDGLAEDEEISGDVEFEVAVENMSSGEGGLKVHVVTVGGKKNHKELTKVKFKVGKKLKPATSSAEAFTGGQGLIAGICNRRF